MNAQILSWSLVELLSILIIGGGSSYVLLKTLFSKANRLIKVEYGELPHGIILAGILVAIIFQTGAATSSLILGLKDYTSTEQGIDLILHSAQLIGITLALVLVMSLIIMLISAFFLRLINKSDKWSDLSKSLIFTTCCISLAMVTQAITEGLAASFRGLDSAAGFFG